MKIGVISNHHFAIPAINYLSDSGYITGLAIPEINGQSNIYLQQYAGSTKISLIKLYKNSLSKSISQWLNKHSIDVVFVLAFPFKIPETVLNIPKFGFINFHPSLLPQYRGPDPLFWQIKKGETETGITAHEMSTTFDAGKILVQEKTQISSNDTYGTLESKLAGILVNCSSNVAALLSNGNIKKFEQRESEASYFGRPGEKDLTINWEEMSANEIINLVRASNPKFQGAQTYFKNFPVRILSAGRSEQQQNNSEPGMVISNNFSGGIHTAAINGGSITIEIVYTQEGCFTGKSFGEIFSVKEGEKFHTTFSH